MHATTKSFCRSLSLAILFPAAGLCFIAGHEFLGLAISSAAASCFVL